MNLTPLLFFQQIIAQSIFFGIQLIKYTLMAGITNQLALKELSKDDLLSLIIRSTDFAAKKHRKQRRLDAEATPYINHPIGKLQNLLFNIRILLSFVVCPFFFKVLQIS